MMKLLSQFDEVLNATPFPRRLDGNISLGIAHGLLIISYAVDVFVSDQGLTYTGPQVAPNESI